VLLSFFSKTSGLEQTCRDFVVANVFFYTQNFKFENFIPAKWSEKKFLQGSVGHQTRLLLVNPMSNDRELA